MSTEPPKEMVNHPSHYQCEPTVVREVADVIELFDLNFNIGNVAKYILRCGKKDDPIQELKKAQKYLDMEVKRLERKKSSHPISSG